ncbi:sigma-54-dependent transcriptional response regulator [Syntrophotalea carbinolica DSM 2380]|uniref:Sigma-54-dependent transcriptional response regulator n=1 Tax=Syntrophotalea carbinolica (strain DSM 2380 / NBRC 103641 / GraBd1) TaxID=338963 RepID=Q3A2K8_SYNC1|nr:sigma-54 dependent transcriptional regulator [Syntrophotalea carbinolica]ABA89399.1 sigma-54-dependent transcriptional response regulator [Syntrophotalea carbinolica DSM 2380]
MGDKVKKILVVDDESCMRHMLRLVLQRAEYVVSEAANGQEALIRLEKEMFDVVLCDVCMPTLDGPGFLKELRARNVSPTVIMMSAYGNLDTAVECLKEGAFDYISKPFKPDEVVLTLRKAEERLRLREENGLLRQELNRTAQSGQMVYACSGMEQAMTLVGRAAQVNSPVLVTGETGTGKELVARALHQQGKRRGKPFIAINCGGMNAGVIDSELFGHIRGAFTGANRGHDGLFVAAEGGTLFLDEIGELPMTLQPRLLRALQEQEVRPVGAVNPRPTDVRIVAATARNLQEEINAGRFRSDLFFRLAVIEIHLPPLRERKGDIALLAEHFLSRLALREGRSCPSLTPEAVESLERYAWPGNVRELANFMEKTAIFCRDDKICMEHLPWEIRRHPRDRGQDMSLKKAVSRIEPEYIRRALSVTGGNRTKAAQLLDISLRNLHYKIREYDLE